jgi:hypothetical protein
MPSCSYIPATTRTQDVQMLYQSPAEFCAEYAKAYNRDQTDEFGATSTLDSVTVVSETPDTARVEVRAGAHLATLRTPGSTRWLSPRYSSWSSGPTGGTYAPKKISPTSDNRPACAPRCGRRRRRPDARAAQRNRDINRHERGGRDRLASARRPASAGLVNKSSAHFCRKPCTPAHPQSVTLRRGSPRAGAPRGHSDMPMSVRGAASPTCPLPRRLRWSISAHGQGDS